MSQGVYVSLMPHSEQIQEMLASLRPIAPGRRMIKIGKEVGSSIFIPDDLEGVDACFSVGTSSQMFFEAYLQEKGIATHRLGPSEPNPPTITSVSQSEKQLGAINTESKVTLQAWLSQTKLLDGEADLLLKIELLGDEYQALLVTRSNALRRFRIICLEISNSEVWGMPEYFELVRAALRKLLRDFYVVHQHANNAPRVLNLNGVEMPQKFTLTFHRKDRVKSLKEDVEVVDTINELNTTPELGVAETAGHESGRRTHPTRKPIEHQFFCDGGLSNRLAVYLFGMYLKNRLDVPVRFSWPRNNWCGASLEKIMDIRGVANDDWDLQSHKLKEHEYELVMHENQVGFRSNWQKPSDFSDLKSFQTCLTKKTKPVFYFNNQFPMMLSPAQIIESVRFLLPSKQIQKKVTDFCLKNNISKHTIGVHVRGTDFPGKINPATLFEHIKTRSEKFFICSDEKNVNELFASLPNCVVFTKAHFPKQLKVNANWNDLIKDDQGRIFNFNVDRNSESVEEALVDLLILSKTNVQRLSNSSFEYLAFLLSFAH